MRRLELIALRPAQLLVVDPKKRMTSVEALKHPWVGKADVGSTNLFAKKEFKVTQPKQSLPLPLATLPSS